MICPICEGKFFYEDEEGRHPCTCIDKRQVALYLRKLGRLQEYAPLSTISPAILAGNILFRSNNVNNAEANFILGSYLLKCGRPDYEVIPFASFMEIILGKHPSHKSYLEIGTELVIVVGLSNEFEYNRADEAVLHFLTERERKGKPVWVFLRTNKAPKVEEYWQSQYPTFDFAMSSCRRKDKSTTIF